MAALKDGLSRLAIIANNINLSAGGLIAHLFHHRHFFLGATSLSFGGGGSFLLVLLPFDKNKIYDQTAVLLAPT